MSNSEAASHKPHTECQLHEAQKGILLEQQAALDNLTTDVRLIAADQRAASDWRTQQAEMNRRLMTETQASRRASEKSADAAVKAVELVEKMDVKWDRKHEEIVGRVATLEDKFEEIVGGPPPATGAPAGPPPRHPSVPRIMPELLAADTLSEDTKVNLMAADRNGVLEAFMRERETTSQLRADVAAMQARLDEKQRHSDRARSEEAQNAKLVLAHNAQKAKFKLEGGKLVVALVSTLVGSVGGVLGILELLRRVAP